MQQLAFNDNHFDSTLLDAKFGKVSFVPQFLVSLYEMVDLPSTESVIGWSTDGDSFQVYNQDLFVLEVLPRFYDTCKLTSWIRQLNMYGFKKIKCKNSDGWSVLKYSNAFFMKDHRHLLEHIKRKSARKKNTTA